MEEPLHSAQKICIRLPQADGLAGFAGLAIGVCVCVANDLCRAGVRSRTQAAMILRH